MTERTPQTPVSGLDAGNLELLKDWRLLAECRAIFANAIEAIVCADARGIITRANPAVERIFGYAPEELVGRNVSCLVPPPDRERHDGYIRRYLETGEAKIIGLGREVTGLRRDGSEVPLDISILEIEVGGDFSFAALMRDISERRRAEHLLRDREQEIERAREELAHVDRLRIANTLSTGIAHELTQPLTAIRLFAGSCRRLLDRNEDDPEALRETLTRIEELAGKAGEIIDNLRDLARPHQPGRGLVDLNAVIRDTVELALIDKRNERIELELQLAPDLPPVEAAKTQIQLVLLNLIRNAHEAVAPGAPGREVIEITSSLLPDDRVRVTVRDSGPGIAAGEFERIFEPFRTGKPEGLGMGLPISRSIIEHHGGDLTANPEFSGGAEFRFTLPAATWREPADAA